MSISFIPTTRASRMKLRKQCRCRRKLSTAGGNCAWGQGLGRGCPQHRGSLCSSVRPSPITDFRHVLAVEANVLSVLHQLVTKFMFGVSGHRAELRDPVDHVGYEMCSADTLLAGLDGEAFRSIRTS